MFYILIFFVTFFLFPIYLFFCLLPLKKKTTKHCIYDFVLYRYYPDLPVRKRAVKRWKKAAIAITRGTDEANRIFDNPHGTADETDVFGAARDTVFGNDTLKQEQRDDPNSGYNVVVAVRAAAKLEEEASKEKAKKVQQDMLKAEESMLKTEESMLEGEESMLKAKESMLEAEEAHEEMQDDAAALLAEKFVKDKVQAIREAAEKMYAEEEAAIQIENTKAAVRNTSPPPFAFALHLTLACCNLPFLVICGSVHPWFWVVVVFMVLVLCLVCICSWCDRCLLS